jgi:circadian clock protein KaiC
MDDATGVAGLDDVLCGGLVQGHLFLLEGTPGAGKTTIATQFLVTGAAAGQRCLYITLSETEAELRDSAITHRWTLEGVDLFELIPPENLLDENQQQSLLYSSDLELGETTRRIFEVFERLRPDRVVLDSLSDPLAGAELAALPPSDPGFEALFRPAELDHPDARRPDRRSHGQDGA